MDSTVFCEACGAALNADAKFCRECGKAQPSGAGHFARPVTATRVRPEATRPIPPSAPIVARPVRPTSPPQAGLTGRDLLLIVLGLALAADLVFAPWFHLAGSLFSGGGLGPLSLSAVKQPKPGLGIAGAIAGGAAALGTLIDRSAVQPIFARLAAIGALIFVVLKFTLPHGETHIPLRNFGVGFWGAAALAVALLVTSFAARPRPRLA